MTSPKHRQIYSFLSDYGQHISPCITIKLLQHILIVLHGICAPFFIQLFVSTPLPELPQWETHRPMPAPPAQAVGLQGHSGTPLQLAATSGIRRSWSQQWQQHIALWPTGSLHLCWFTWVGANSLPVHGGVTPVKQHCYTVLNFLQHWNSQPTS